MKMILNGFRFGLLLQIAIGPIFVFVLKTATQSGILAAEAAVLAATLVDAIFVSLAILGVGKLFDKPRIKNVIKYFGALVLIYFGIGIILGSSDIHIIPGLSGLLSSANITNSFFFSFILTASSPLTILFWTGLFATKLASEGYSKTDMKYYGIGAVLTTFIFLGTVAIIAGLLEPLMSQELVNALNILVGIVLIGFAVKMAFSKVPPSVVTSE